MNYFLETERLVLRKITEGDFEMLCGILQDIDVMYAWEHAFSDLEVRDWINKNLQRYASDGFSYFMAIDKTTNIFVGVMGPLIEKIDEQPCIGVAYILNKSCWGKGYAKEGVKACIEYAFNELGANKVIAQIRPENLASRHVAESVGMKIEGEYIKTYQGKEMLHYIYGCEK